MAQQTLEKQQSETKTAAQRAMEFGVWTDPFAFLRRFSDEMERIFDTRGLRSLTRFPFRAQRPSAEIAWLPDVEIVQRDDAFVMRADLPGLKKEDVKLEITDNELTLQGERKQEREEKGEGYIRSERSYGSFYRCLALPEGAETDKAKATFKDGVLEVVIPTPGRKAPTGRKLEIQ